MNKEQIIQKLTDGVIPRKRENRYIRRMERMRKDDQYVLSIPLWKNGERKSHYLGSYDSLTEARQARAFTLNKIAELENVSLFSPHRENWSQK